MANVYKKCSQRIWQKRFGGGAFSLCYIHTHSGVWIGNVCRGRLFAEMILYTRRTHMVSRRCGCAHGFSVHQIDGSVFHMYDIRNGAHCDESNGAGSTLIR